MRHTIRCYTFGCGRFAKKPEGHGDPKVLSAFPECARCEKKRKLRDKRAAVLAMNTRDVLYRY